MNSNAINIQDYMPLVKSFIYKYRGKGIADDELVGLGIDGLQAALSVFDPDRGAFATIARLYIKEKIVAQFIKNKTYFNTYAQGVLFDLDTCRWNDGNGLVDLSEADTISLSSTLECPEESTISKLDTEKLRQAIELLIPTRKNIILQRFFYEGDKPPTRQALGKELGLSHQRISEIEEQAIRDLRKILCQ